MTELPPIDTPEQRLALRRSNRRVFAARWPAGVLEECERLDAEHLGWSVWWTAGNTSPGWEMPAGFSATMPEGEPQRKANGGWMRPAAFGATVPELVEAMAAMEARLAEQKAQRDRQWDSMRRGLR